MDVEFNPDREKRRINHGRIGHEQGVGTDMSGINGGRYTDKNK